MICKTSSIYTDASLGQLRAPCGGFLLHKYFSKHQDCFTNRPTQVQPKSSPPPTQLQPSNTYQRLCIIYIYQYLIQYAYSVISDVLTHLQPTSKPTNGLLSRLQHLGLATLQRLHQRRQHLSLAWPGAIVMSGLAHCMRFIYLSVYLASYLAMCR